MACRAHLSSFSWPLQRHMGHSTSQPTTVHRMAPSVPSRVLRVPRMRRRPKRRPMALAAESAMPSTMMPEKVVESAGTHAPTGVLDTADTHTGAAMPANAASVTACSGAMMHGTKLSGTVSNAGTIKPVKSVDNAITPVLTGLLYKFIYIPELHERHEVKHGLE